MSLYSPWNQTTYGFVMIWGEVKVNSRFPKDQQVDVFFLNWHYLQFSKHYLFFYRVKNAKQEKGNK